MPTPEPFCLELHPFYIVPVCHYAMEFGREVQRSFEAIRPNRVALELPPFLGDDFTKAVGRLPRLTLITYMLGVETLVLPVEPSDPLVEAARSALQAGVPLDFIDLPVQYLGRHNDRVPDSTSVTALGLKVFWEQWCAGVPNHSDPEDIDREAHMANRLMGLGRFHPEEKIMVVMGLAHVRRVLEYLQTGDAPMKVPEVFVPPTVALVQPDAEVTRALHQEMPWILALYELQRGGPGRDKTWEAPPLPPEEPADVRDHLKNIDPSHLVASLENMLGRRRRPPPLTPQQQKSLSRYLQGLAEEPSALMQLLSQFSSGTPPQVDLPAVAVAPPARAFTFRQVDERRGDLLQIYRESLGRDRQQMIQSLIAHASVFYEDNTGEHVKPWQVATLYQYMRNYARLLGRLLPNLSELVIAARGVADDNLSYEVWDLGGFYPWVPVDESDSDLPMLRAEDLKNMHVYAHLRRKLPRLRKRATEGQAGDWGDEFDKGGGICSYPAEDIIIEDYARYLQQKAIQQMNSEKTRVEPFTTSLLDGIDMRETLRNWHDRKLFVREIKRTQGGVGAVVLIFDEDSKNSRYPWCMTWHGEHAQESDMAFYATPANMKLVGPGISRCEYGGLLMTYPNRRLGNVWGDVFYKDCRSKSEILLMGALEYGLERHVVYVGSTPPRSHFQSVAGRLGKRIVYLPIGSLSPQSIKRIRVFHVLSDHGKRQIAKDFIW